MCVWKNVKKLAIGNYISFNTEFFKDRKKAFKLKGSCSAKLNPFCAIYKDDNTLIKAFYSEAKECTFNNIKTFIDEIRERNIM